MTVDELVARILSGPIVFAFDTNFLYAHRSFRSLEEISRRVNLANEVISPAKRPIQLRVSALVHEERCLQIRHERAKKGLPFSAAAVNQLIDQLGFEVAEFTRADAESVAEHLFSRFPDRESWQNAKKGNDSKSATVDWFIAAHGIDRKWIAVSDDGGSEWAMIPKVRLTTWKAALDRIVGNAFAPPE